MFETTIYMVLPSCEEGVGIVHYIFVLENRCMQVSRILENVPLLSLY